MDSSSRGPFHFRLATETTMELILTHKLPKILLPTESRSYDCIILLVELLLEGIPLNIEHTVLV